MSTVSILETHDVKLLGAGNKLVVLSHGLGGSQASWNLILPHLFPHYRVLLYNLRGHGQPHEEDKHRTNLEDLSRYKSVQGFADDLLSILSELQVDKCLYVGHSVSGMVGCLAAAARPQLFEKLILIGASPRYLNDAGYEGGFESEQLKSILTAIKNDYVSWVKDFVPIVSGPEATEETVQQCTSSYLNLEPNFALVVVDAIFNSDFRKDLPAIKVPCHVIQTKEDAAVPMAVAEFLQRQLGAELEVLEARGHLPHLTCPHLLVPVLERALQSGKKNSELVAQRL